MRCAIQVGEIRVHTWADKLHSYAEGDDEFVWGDGEEQVPYRGLAGCQTQGYAFEHCMQAEKEQMSLYDESFLKTLIGSGIVSRV